MSGLSHTDLKGRILRRFICGETFHSIGSDFAIQHSMARTLSQTFIRELWAYIKEFDIEHPYTAENYPHAFIGHSTKKSFMPYYLTPLDMRAQAKFWTKLIDRVLSERGSVKRSLTEKDAFQRLELKTRPTIALEREGVATIGDLFKLIADKERWLNIVGFGEATRSHILNKLSYHGFHAETESTPETMKEIMLRALACIKNPGDFDVAQRERLIAALEERTK